MCRSTTHTRFFHSFSSCNGVNFAHLPIADDEFAGHALEQSFNTLHAAGDTRLDHVTYGNHQSSSGLEFYTGWNGSYGCISCRRWRENDDDDFKNTPPSPYAPTVPKPIAPRPTAPAPRPAPTRPAPTRPAPTKPTRASLDVDVVDKEEEEDEDDEEDEEDLIMGFMERDDPILLGGHTAEWEVEFASLLMKSGIKQFSTVGDCTIRVKPDLGQTEQLALPASHLVNVDIDIDCKGVNMQKLTLEEDVIIAQALEYSFNQVHVGHDDSELDYVVYGKSEHQNELGQHKEGGWKGSYGCSLCTEDEDMLHAKKKTVMQAAWEVAFTKELVESMHASLVGAKSCTISMSVPKATGAMCGLRACAES
jgi:hypothetical protein